MPPMQHVDAELIETDLQARIDYLAKFIEFGAADVEALHGAAPIVKGLVPAAVDAVCKSYSIVWCGTCRRMSLN